LVLEAGRRIGGNIYLFVCLLLAVYPMFADLMPEILYGQSFSFPVTLASSMFGESGFLGLPMKVIGDILIGFLVFAAVLISTGGGKFFLNLALSIVGGFRGGPAKVAVVASGFFGSMSGSIFSNIVATGSITIPAMKKLGYPPHYAGAIEACASTGGVLMPPVMGAVAFVMAELLDVPYADIIIVAAIPAILYYLGLLMQVDAYAAKTGLRGLAKEEIPSFKKTFKEGWHFIVAFLFLIWGLLYMRWEVLTPFYATGVLIILAMLKKESRFNLSGLVNIIEAAGRLIVEALAIILPIGFVVNGFIITGLAPSFIANIVSLGGESPYPILLLGVVICYILGMMGMAISTYIFLAITLAPALVILGFDVLAVHLFIIYYTMLSAITPPVAVGAFLASSIAGASPMKTAWQAVRLGVVIYFIPFFFVFNSSLVLQGSPQEALYLFILCVIGIVFIAAGCEGYLLKFGIVRMWARPLLVIAGLLIGFPNLWPSTVIGAVLAVVIVGVMLLTRRIEDHDEGSQAFVEKREPVFKDR